MGLMPDYRAQHPFVPADKPGMDNVCARPEPDQDNEPCGWPKEDHMPDTTTTGTITMDNTTQRFFQGVAAAARVREAHASTLHATRQAKSDLFWFYVGALAGEEYGCKSAEDFAGFIQGANTRAPANDHFECNHLGECDPHIVDCQEHPSHR